jgi:hypothetical protein
MSKSGALGRAFGSLLSFVTRTTVCILQYAALLVSVGVAVYTIGDYTRRAVHDKKTGTPIIRIGLRENLPHTTRTNCSVFDQALRSKYWQNQEVKSVCMPLHRTKS